VSFDERKLMIYIDLKNMYVCRYWDWDEMALTGSVIKIWPSQ
jgi:hypothetical protein